MNAPQNEPNAQSAELVPQSPSTDGSNVELSESELSKVAGGLHLQQQIQSENNKFKVTMDRNP